MLAAGYTGRGWNVADVVTDVVLFCRSRKSCLVSRDLKAGGFQGVAA